MRQIRLRTITRDDAGEHNKIYLCDSIDHIELGKVIDDIITEKNIISIDITPSDVDVIVSREML